MRLSMCALFLSLLFADLLMASPLHAPEFCKTDHALLNANKKLVQDFFSFAGPLESQARRFLAENYVQHNPRFLKMDGITGTSGRKAWLEAMRVSQLRGIRLVDLHGIELRSPVILMAECDLVTAIYRGKLQDPDLPDHTYEAFAFETFRIRQGRFVEHWDQITLDKGWMP